MRWLHLLLARLLVAWERLYPATHPDVVEQPQPLPQPVQPPPTPPPASGDYIDIATIEVRAKNTPGVTPSKIRKAKVTAEITEAQTDGHYIYTRYKSYDWPDKDGVNAVAFFGYYLDGKPILRKFDWWRTGGQAKKTAENINNGYDGLVMPPRGTECYTMLCSVSGAERSNICKVTWR